ncbi:10768_t:CDS:2, partial [Funneliformis geosporum]
IEIDSNDIRTVIHVKALIINLIQKAGRAGQNGNIAMYIVFFSKKDICTNYSIIAKYQEKYIITNALANEQN